MYSIPMEAKGQRGEGEKEREQGLPTIYMANGICLHMMPEESDSQRICLGQVWS